MKLKVLKVSFGETWDGLIELTSLVEGSTITFIALDLEIMNFKTST